MLDNKYVFSERDLPEIFSIGYRSNHANFALSIVLDEKKEDLEFIYRNHLRRMLVLLDDVEIGRKVLDSFDNFSGEDLRKTSIYWNFMSLILRFSEKSFNDITIEVREIRECLSDIIKVELPEEIRKNKILKVKKFLSMLSDNYQMVFSARNNYYF